MVGEFIDEPESNRADDAGKPGTPSEGVGIRMLPEVVDQPPEAESPPRAVSRLPIDLEASTSATTLFERAVTLVEQLVQQEGRSDLASDLARAYANKAVAVRELGEQRAGLALADQTIALYERLVQQEGQQDLTPDLATAYLNKAAAVRVRGDQGTAVTWYDRAITLYERLVQQEGRHEFADQLQTTYQNKTRALGVLAAPGGTVGDAGRNVGIEGQEDLGAQPSASPTTLQQGSPPPMPQQPPAIAAATEPFAPLLDQANRGEESLAVLRGWAFVRELGRGGMGAVALIKHAASGEQLALKVMRPELAADSKAKARFEREIAITRALKHPHVVPQRNWGCWQDVYFFTSEYCDGGDAAQLRQQSAGKLSPQAVRPIILQALDALDYAHHAEVRAKLQDGSVVEARGVVHRDVKPSNLFLCGSGAARIAKLGDFGLAKAFATAGLTGLTSRGLIAGSIWFMPQQLLDDFLLAKPEVDVWSAAASLYYLLTGQPPRDFASEPPDRWLWVVSAKPPVPIRQRDPSIPSALADVIDHALDDRDCLHFQSAAAFKRALEAVL